MVKITKYAVVGPGEEAIMGESYALIELEDRDGCFVIGKDTIADLFEKYGGSFTQALGIALHRADHKNTAKILRTWEEMTREYLEKFMDFNPHEQKPIF